MPAALISASASLALALVASTSSGAPYRDQLVAEAARRDLAADRGWQTLLHYEPRPFGGAKSTVDAEAFFIAEHGKTDPAAELAATLEAFFAPPVEESETVQHPQCRFRARFSWLVAQLSIDERLPRQPCQRFAWWKDRLRVDSVSVVFAFAYLNNPASMFGHTFLRLNREKRGPGAELTTYSVNFSAVPTTDNPLFYALLGLTGGFEGRYSTTPYYLKVKEYSDVEHRSLWEYDLTFTPPEIERLVEHLWEMGVVHFDYFYLDENCSYHLLALLEVARPSLRLLDVFPAWAIPADTLRAVLDVPGLVGARAFRPSAYDVMLARRAGLSGDEVGVAAEVAEGLRAPTDLPAWPVERQAAVLDTAAALLAFRAGQTPSDAQKKTRRAMLIRRGRLGVPRTEVEVPPPAPPEAGHRTARWAFGGGADSVSGFVTADMRFALHDLVASAAGYVPGSQIEFVRLGARIPTTPSFDPQLDLLRLLRITSLAPMDRWSPRISWRFSTGLERLRQDACDGHGCLFYELAGGPGVAFELGPLLTYAFADVSLGAGPAFRDDYRIAAGASAGFLLDVVPRWWRIRAEASYLYPIFGQDRPRFLPGDDGAPFRLALTTAVNVTTDIELRAHGVRARGYERVSGAVVLYY